MIHNTILTLLYIITQTTAQTIDGFGASDAWSFWKIGTWNDSIQTQTADWLFSMEDDTEGNPKGIGLSIWRFNAGAGSAEQGDDAKINRDTRTYEFARQTGQRHFMQLAKERGVPTFLAFYNTPPVHLTQNGLGTNTGRGGTLNLRDDAYDDFTRYICDMIEKAKNEDGIEFEYISPFNEPDGHWNWQGPKQEGTPATNREIARLVRLLSQELATRNLKTQIIVNESSDYRCLWATHQTDYNRGYEVECFWNKDSVDTYIGNLPNVARKMAAHSYWTNTPILKPGDKGYERKGLYGYRKRVKETLEKHDVGFWMSELCIMGNDEEIHGGGGFDFTMEVALYVARVMHYDLTVANARSWQWWRAAGGNYKDGLLRMWNKGERQWTRGSRTRQVVENDSIRDSKLMWTLGNFSRFVRPGAVRLDVKGDMAADGVMLSSYRNTDGSVVTVAINYGKEDQVINIKGGTQNAIAYRTSDTEGENLKRIGEMNMENALLKGRSVTTFVMK